MTGLSMKYCEGQLILLLVIVEITITPYKDSHKLNKIVLSTQPTLHFGKILINSNHIGVNFVSVTST